MLPVEGKVRRKTDPWRCGHEIGEEAKASLQWRRYRLRRRSTTLLDAKAGRLPRGASRERAGLIGLWDKANDDGQAVGAVSSEAAEWYAIDWPTIHRNVRRLQVRIAQAAKEGRWGKVRALQRLLTHSYSGKVLAVRRVTENNGKKTPGVDREIWDTPEKKTQAVHEFKQGGYHPRPLRRVYIPKSDGKTMRPLGIPTVNANCT